MYRGHEKFGDLESPLKVELTVFTHAEWDRGILRGLQSLGLGKRKNGVAISHSGQKDEWSRAQCGLHECELRMCIRDPRGC